MARAPGCSAAWRSDSLTSLTNRRCAGDTRRASSASRFDPVIGWSETTGESVPGVGSLTITAGSDDRNSPAGGMEDGREESVQGIYGRRASRDEGARPGAE